MIMINFSKRCEFTKNENKNKKIHENIYDAWRLPNWLKTRWQM